MAARKNFNRNAPGLFVEADTREAMFTSGFMQEYARRLERPEFKGLIEEEVWLTFSRQFDKHMSDMARANPDEFHHLYEYSAAGDGFSHVKAGRNRYKLWKNTARRAGSGIVASWEWVPAKQFNPTYHQRREGKIGHDPIRDLSQKDFDLLVAKSHNRKHVFIWKAPMLEYQLTTQRRARPGEWLFLPGRVRTPMKGSDGGFMFAKEATSSWMQPGKTWQTFTANYTFFWGQVVPSRFDAVFGRAVAKTIREGAEAILRKRPRVTSGRLAQGSRVRISAFADTWAAYEQGARQAATAIRLNERTIKGIKEAESTFTALTGGGGEWHGKEGWL